MSLEKLFIGSATAKILDILWEYQDMDLTLTDIADEAGIHYKDDMVVKKLIKFLNELNIRLAEREASRQGIATHETEMVLA